jgi:UTP:GlnB (protein PII) uridylyltransferase
MSDRTAKANPRDTPPELEKYLHPDLPRASFIERGQAYLADIGQWLRENNVRLRGRQVLARFTRAHDVLIQAAHAHVVAAWKLERPRAAVPDIAVVALGGYGRGEQCLRSDVDLLLLMEQRHTADDLAFVKSLLHLLIDMRLNLGYSTRTIADCEGAIGNDLESTTSMVETRLLAGNRGLYQRFEEEVGQALTGRWRKWFLKAVYQQWQERREKWESTVFLLEPNLKEGPGGLRDVHTVQWMLFGLTGSTELKALKELARFDDADLRRYREAIAMLQLLRNEVHIASGGKNDQLLFHYQTAVAGRLGYEADTHRSAEEVFMADYYRHAREIARLSTRAVRAMIQHERSVLGELFGSLRRKRLDGGLLVQDGVLYPEGDPAAWFAEDPHRILGLFERAGKLGLRVSDETLEALEHLARELGPGFRLDPANNERFMKILKNAHHVHRPLADMHACGVLGELFGSLRRKRVDGRLMVQDGVLFPEGSAAEYFKEDEHRIMALFERAARSGWRISEETLEDLARVVPALGPGYRLDPANHERFLKILKNPAHVHQPIADMHACGILGKYLPEFEHITCMVRIDYYHHYTVDEHTIKALEMLERLLAEPPEQRSFAGQVAAEVKRLDLLCLALLLHDVGKGYGRGHALRGGQIAQRVGERLGLPRADVETVTYTGAFRRLFRFL